MIIEKTLDTRKRNCAVCNKSIVKGSIIVKYDFIMDEWKNSRMWFAHIQCLIQRLEKVKEELRNP